MVWGQWRAVIVRFGGGRVGHGWWMAGRREGRKGWGFRVVVRVCLGEQGGGGV